MAERGGNDFQLIIPERGEQVKISSGSTLTVSCHLSPAISAVDMEISWFGETSCVCSYKNREMVQGAGYEGRATLFIHDLKKGNVSLRVADFTDSDLGVYMCQVTSQNTTQQITVNVAEEVSAIMKDQHFFKVDYKMEETSNKSSNDSEYQGDSDNQQLKGETNNEFTSPQSPDRKQSVVNRRGSRTFYCNEGNKCLHEMDASRNNNFQLVVPSRAEEPEVSLGSHIIIPCHLSPEISAVDMEIQWFKETDCVCQYRDRQVTEGVWFKDRVCLFTMQKLKEGNVSLRLKNFRLSDIGNYHCQVISEDRKQEITVNVRVNPENQSPTYQGGNEDKNTKEASERSSRRSSHRRNSDKKHEDYSMNTSSNADFELVVPPISQEARVSIGSEFTVPCYSFPQICASVMKISWFKETDCVCVYKNREVNEGRMFRDRVSLDTLELDRGNVSLRLRCFSPSDVGDYYCQISSADTTKEITVGVRIKPEVQPVRQASTFQHPSIQLLLSKIDRIWTQEETDKMDKSALMAEMKVNNVQELCEKLIRSYTERDRQLERAELELRATRKDLNRVLRLNPEAQF